MPPQANNIILPTYISFTGYNNMWWVGFIWQNYVCFDIYRKEKLQNILHHLTESDISQFVCIWFFFWFPKDNIMLFKFKQIAYRGHTVTIQPNTKLSEYKNQSLAHNVKVLITNGKWILGYGMKILKVFKYSIISWKPKIILLCLQPLEKGLRTYLDMNFTK